MNSARKLGTPVGLPPGRASTPPNKPLPPSLLLVSHSARQSTGPCRKMGLMSSKRLKARDIRGKPRQRILDLAGERFGMLGAIKFYGMRGKRTFWKCRCDCGRSTRVEMGNLRSGRTQSCGRGACKRLPVPERPPEYSFWLRGVRDNSTFRDFDAFLKCVGPRPSPQHKLHRRHPERPYGPRNCEWSLTGWARVVEHDCRRLTIAQWATWLGISVQAVHQRLATHDLPTALSRKPLKRGRRKKL